MLSPCELVCSTRTWAKAASENARMVTKVRAARISTTFPAYRLVDAPDSGAAGGDVEKREAEEHRVDTAIGLRHQQSERHAGTHGRRAELHDVHVEVGNRHLAAADERGQLGEQSDH